MKPTELPHGHENILLVDDEQMLSDMASVMLESIGYNVTGLTDCKKVLDLFEKRSHDFDLAIIDYGMPKNEWNAISAKVKKHPPGYSNYSMYGISQYCRQ